MLDQGVAMAKMMVGFKGPIPSPFPFGKGAGWLMAVTVCQVNVWFEEWFGFSPLGDVYPKRSEW